MTTQPENRTMTPFCAFPGLRVRPIERTLAMVRKKWTVNVLLEIYYGNESFSGIMERVPDLSTRMLSLRLAEMKKFRLIRKTRVAQGYKLTEKGFELISFLAVAAKFSMQHNDVTG
jgi:DNA-binding HxlR family transcriptional regulator